MHLAISLAALDPDTPRALLRAADLGYRFVEIPLRPDEFDYGYRRKPNARFYRELRQQADALGLAVWSVASLPLSQEQMFSGRARKEILLGGAAAAGILGARVFVVQPADIYASEDAFYAGLQGRKAPAVVEGFDEIWAQVVNRRMTLALQNRDYWLGSPLTNQPDRLADLLEELAIGCALDVRAAVYRSTLANWLGCVGERLALATLYDLDAAGALQGPAGPEWPEWLAQLAATRLKCAVVRPGRDEGDAALSDGRRALEAALLPER
ncbi:MAG: hypothetical protein ACRDHL_02310 [Candidatus Promineifilaceae bacterium]